MLNFRNPTAPRNCCLDLSPEVHREVGSGAISEGDNRACTCWARVPKTRAVSEDSDIVRGDSIDDPLCV